MGFKVKSLVKENSFYLKSPKKILKDINDKFLEEKTINIFGIDLLLCTNVYPSQCFRTTNFILESISSKIEDKSICDMGCDMGIIGLYSLKNGAKKVVQADINPAAIENANLNKKLYKYDDKKLSIYESDCFENIPKEIFDIIIFNIPFHSENYKVNNYLEFAFHDPNFRTLKKFLSQLKFYANSETEIIVAFSNKGDVKTLESIFDKYNFEWKLWRKINGKTEFDNRLYLLKL